MSTYHSQLQGLASAPDSCEEEAIYTNFLDPRPEVEFPSAKVGIMTVLMPQPYET